VSSSIDRFVAGLDYPMFIVTAGTGPEPADRAGCLIGFATQCSIDPGRMLICLSKANHTYQLAKDAAQLAVHRLDPAQHELAELFGGSTGDEVDKFARCAWHPGPGGVPLLDDCPVWMVGTVVQRTDLGDHVGFVLDPVEVGGEADGRALSFRQVRDIEAGHPA
jgi:flavin reductase (DIM6/NTAB) family NADH-FMN oxidoreductase RutF